MSEEGFQQRASEWFDRILRFREVLFVSALILGLIWFAFPELKYFILAAVVVGAILGLMRHRRHVG
jgi:disulfide bond formation protein DsbB